MADDPKTGGALRAEGAPKSVRKGDVPDALERRYYTDERGGRGLGFYADARIATAAFRDEGRRLVAPRSDPNVARDLAQIARHRGWSIVVVQGEPTFRREAWLAARAAGLEVRGYRPTERDVQELARRTLEIERRSRADRDRSLPAAPASEHRARRPADSQATLRVVDTVVKARVASPQAQDRILAAARERLTGWLEREDRGRTRAGPTVSAGPAEVAHRKERTRGR